MQNKIKLDWYIVCGSMEIEELEKYDKIRSWMPKNQRHSLFYMIKYPGHLFYKGSWGDELLHFVDDGPYRGKVGKVYCTYNRYQHISKWFLNTMFSP